MATNNNNNKCICLARVSTDKQSYDEQVRDLINIAKKDGYKPSNIIVINNKESAIKLDEEHRLGLVEMKERIAEDSTINCVYVREVSRIGRRYDVLTSIKLYFLTNKIQLVVCGEEKRIELFDSKGNPTLDSGIMFEIACQFAQTEMEDKKKRFAQGKREAVRNNKVIGSKILYGYTKDKNNVIIIDDEKADIVRRIFNTYANDKDISTAALYRELNERGEVSGKYSYYTGGVNFVRNIIANEAYKGGRSKTNKVIPFNYPQIVDADLWERANEKLRNKANRPLYDSKYILYAKGLVECECGHKMIGSVDALLAYRCNNNCMKVINLNCVEHIAWTEAKKCKVALMSGDYEKNKELFAQQIKDNEKKIEISNKKIAELDASILRAYKGYVKGGVSEDYYNESVKQIQKERKDLERTIMNMEQTNANLSELIRRHDAFDELTAYGGIDAIVDDNERRKIVKETIGRIVVSEIENTPNNIWRISEITDTTPEGYKVGDLFSRKLRENESYEGMTPCNGKLITVFDKNGIESFDHYYYLPSTRPKLYLAFKDDTDNYRMTLAKDITDQVVKRFKRKRY